MIDKYIIAGNTPQGFVSYFEDFMSNAERIICLKGGSGVGKSTFINAVASKAREKNYRVITVPCSSDINSLDLVKVDELGLIVVDATSPHTIEPPNYGIKGEIFNLGGYLNLEVLKGYKTKLGELLRQKSLYYKCMYNHLKNCKNHLNNIDGVYFENISIDCINEACNDLIGNFLIAPKPSIDDIKSFSGYIDGNGYQNIVKDFIDGREVIKITSKCNTLSRIAIGRIAQYLDGLCVKTEKYYSQFSPDEVESIGLGEYFITTVGNKSDHEYNLDIMIDSLKFRGYIPIVFDERTGFSASIAQAGEFYSLARGVHEHIEEVYLSAMDFEGVERDREKLLKNIF